MTAEPTAAPSSQYPVPPLPNADDTALWVERTGHRRYTGRSSRGAEVLIGSVGDEGCFSPGELLKIALAGCAGLSIDNGVSRRLGEDVPVTITVGGLGDEAEDRYPALADDVRIDLSSLDEATRERLLVVMRRAIYEHCTVGRTLKASAEVTTTINGAG